MVKQKSKVTPKSKLFLHRKSTKITASIIAAIALIAGIFYFFPPVPKDDPTVIREVLISSVENLKSPAPIEAKTGEVYFPDAKLFTPKQPSSVNLTYSYDDSTSENEPANPVLSISTRQLINELSGDLYNAQDSLELFNKLPQLQACQRGVSIAANPIRGDNTVKLSYEKKVNDGRTLYVYTDKECKHSDRIVDAIKELQSY